VEHLARGAWGVRTPLIEEVEAREVQLILWRERALVAEAQVRALETALSDALEATRP
jgi:hypothetical protein